MLCSRRLALSIVRRDVKSGGSPQAVSQPCRRRFGAEPDYPLLRSCRASTCHAHSIACSVLINDVFTMCAIMHSTCAYERRLPMPARGTKTGNRDENINLRASQSQKALIDRAADAPGRSPVGFHARDGVPGTLSRIKSPGDNSAVIFQFPLRSYLEAMGG